MFDLRKQSLVCIFRESSRERNKLLSRLYIAASNEFITEVIT